MSKVGQIERATQNRIVRLFREQLKYSYLGNLEKEEDNSNVDEALLTAYLTKKGYSTSLISKTLFELNKTVTINTSDDLYQANKNVYAALRYGINVKEEAGQNKTTVHLIDWKNPHENDFAIAEEVTIRGEHKKRPDIVIYVNGIALGVLELKRSTVSVSEGIRQNNDNQKHLFIKPFYTTIQLVMAGQDVEGLRYAAIDTSEKYYLKWKEVSEEFNPNDSYLLELTKSLREQADKADNLLDKHIIEMLNKERLLEILHDFVVFDRGQKKFCRPNQYFGLKAAQEHIRLKEGGIIWHTQGSGKSLTMVWLTKWIREYNPNARVLIITDRDELDKQIKKVFKGVGEDIERTKSGADLIEKLNDTKPWLLCSLIHKFGNKEEGADKSKDYDNYLEELKNSLPKDFKPKGDFYVFVDECHRTQSGDLNKAMRQLLGEKALFIGFTGTPIMQADKKQSITIFGKYIHTYKFDEAVKDGVVLDLRYEARDIEQKISSPDKIDTWFDSKTKGLTDFAKTELKQKWGTMKKVFSSVGRLQKIVADILLDMETRERLQNGRGNAILVSGSIYNACRYYQLFQEAGFTRCAIITSFAPSYADIKGEGEGHTEKLMQYEIYQKMLNGKTSEDFEDEAKKRFIDEPAQMKLLIVVDKLLTGFDAPSATYLYIDKSMKDHGLFQAICRVNRLDGDDKDYGYIIDYKDLFGSLENAYNDFTSKAFEDYDKADVEGLLSNRLNKGKERLDDALETIKALCELVAPPKGTQQYIVYFCGNPQIKDDLKDSEPKRVALYKAVISLIRAYANIADEMEEAGYKPSEIEAIKNDLKHFESVRKEIQLASGDWVDLKQYEPAMRHLIDSYIGAEESKKVSAFDDFSLVELLVKDGTSALDKLPESITKNKAAMAETIENNLRKVIIEESPTNPIYYEKMSVLLDELIKLRNEEAAEYEKYLEEIIKLAVKVKKPETSNEYPSSINTQAKRALYDNLDRDETLSMVMDAAIIYGKHDNWEGNLAKEKHLKNKVVKPVLEEYYKPEKLEPIFKVIKEQKDYK
ncbi:type I restriction endonuclease subunit R [Flavobacterium soyangense]|uniref:Type I restriction enzyme endonuclease subunit n=1 Tax=Flavobacterium soyangense TaxID=2023265 RepID=A0A930UBW5_9FLAO|nr:type I restriction endonuclease subunit R [Flavobacterium soyangense]MBF2709312.1 type I restriction endonuclease subunit R [Flavobacterium soyangense]